MEWEKGTAMNQTAIRPDFLVHWIGKDIHGKKRFDDGVVCDYAELTDEQRKRYLSHLRSSLTEGLWMTNVTESIFHPESYGLGRNLGLTCFAEIRLSQTLTHTKRYGCLGLGFSRSFVTCRSGGPVHYVSGDQSDVVTETILDLSALKWEYKTEPPAHDVLISDPDNIRTSIMNLRAERVEPTITLDTFFNLLSRQVEILLAFLKPMYDIDESYSFIEESEWRIVLCQRVRDREDFARISDSNGLLQGKLKYAPPDLKLLILPDDITRQMMFDDREIIFVVSF